jgi:hypothetical protein
MWAEPSPLFLEPKFDQPILNTRLNLPQLFLRLNTQPDNSRISQMGKHSGSSNIDFEWLVSGDSFFHGIQNIRYCGFPDITKKLEGEVDGLRAREPCIDTEVSESTRNPADLG